jgi:hypothetical protein
MKSSESDLNQLSHLNSVNLKTSKLLRVIEATVKTRKVAAAVTVWEL